MIILSNKGWCLETLHSIYREMQSTSESQSLSKAFEIKSDVLKVGQFHGSRHIYIEIVS